jgi:hypothetical protein
MKRMKGLLRKAGAHRNCADSTIVVWRVSIIKNMGKTVGKAVAAKPKSRWF